MTRAAASTSLALAAAIAHLHAQQQQPVSLRSPITAGVSSLSAEFGWYGVAISDFNGDGRPDIAHAGAASGNAAGGVLLGFGDGAFRPAPTALPAALPAAPVAAGLNGDARADLIASCQGGGFLAGNGDGTFRAATIAAISEAAPSRSARPFVADFNADSRPDVACGADIFLNSGAGVFRRLSPPLSTAPDTFIVDVAGPSASRDGRLIVLLRTDTGAAPAILTTTPALFYAGSLPIAF